MFINDLEQKELQKYLEHFDFADHIRNKTFLITGAKGIIGSGLIKWLLYENKVHGTNVRIIASSRTLDVPDWIEEADNISFCKFGDELSACAGRGGTH